MLYTPSPDREDVQPRISIIIPTRNRADVLPGCLDRLLAESYSAFEVIVIDTSSSEDTQEVLARYPMVTNYWLGDIPFSMVRNRNIGISHARGEIIAFLDDDSYILPGWLDEIAHAFEDPTVAAAGGRVISHPWSIPQRGEPIAILDLERDFIWGAWDRIVDHLVDVPHLMGCNCAVRRDVALEVGGFDTNFTGSANLEETDFFFRVSQMSGRVVFVPSAVVEHHNAPRPDGLTRSRTNYTFRFSMVRNRLYFLRKHRAPGRWFGLRRQILDASAETSKLLASAATFATASVAGIAAGMLTTPVGKSEGLTQSPTLAAQARPAAYQPTVRQLDPIHVSDELTSHANHANAEIRG